MAVVALLPMLGGVVLWFYLDRAVAHVSWWYIVVSMLTACLSAGAYWLTGSRWQKWLKAGARSANLDVPFGMSLGAAALAAILFAWLAPDWTVWHGGLAWIASSAFIGWLVGSGRLPQG